MVKNELDFLIRDEEAAYKYLETHIWGKSWKKCPFCFSTRPYFLSSGRFRCRKCRKDFRDWTGRWLGMLRIGASQWLWVVRHFEKNLTPLHASRKTKLSYPTLLKAYHVIRKAILYSELNIAYSQVEGKANRICLGLKQKNGKVSLSIIEDPDLNKLQKKSLRGLYMRPFLALKDVLNHDWVVLNPGNSGSGYKKIIKNSSPESAFDHFALLHLRKHHGVSSKYLPLYFSEIAFRYNFENEVLFEKIVTALSQPIIVM